VSKKGEAEKKSSFIPLYKRGTLKRVQGGNMGSLRGEAKKKSPLIPLYERGTLKKGLGGNTRSLRGEAPLTNTSPSLPQIPKGGGTQGGGLP
jgi:hypothetical protein